MSRRNGPRGEASSLTEESRKSCGVVSKAKKVWQRVSVAAAVWWGSSLGGMPSKSRKERDRIAKADVNYEFITCAVGIVLLEHSDGRE